MILRSGNAKQGLETCHLQGSKQKKQWVGQGCCKDTLATGLKNNSKEERKQSGGACPQCCFLQCTAADAI